MSALGIAAPPRSLGARRRPEQSDERLRSSDLRLLGWLAEQYGAPATQLELLLGRGDRTIQRTVARLRAAGLVQVVRMLVGEPAWIIPTTAGIRAAGYGFPTWRPRVGLLAHVTAVNAVRLHVQSTSPGTEWVSERLLVGERASGEHLPDGVAMTVKSIRRTRAILDELADRFDAVVYFCAAGPHRLLSELDGSGRWPGLSVRRFPPAPTHPSA